MIPAIPTGWIWLAVEPTLLEKYAQTKLDHLPRALGENITNTCWLVVSTHLKNTG